MELTTAEILDNLKGRPVDPSATPKIKRVFLNSDLVKFAKFVPPRALAAEMEKELMLIVESTKLEGTDNDAEADTRFKKIPDALVS
ncbi:MAG: hypothetical protein HYZ52_01380 [Candidatus Omnitrophica bacterium]|nr:hypothetical protein [Candidatus Omnitrophota bacterium]